MGLTRLYAVGRRLMLRDDAPLPDHDKSLTISGDVATYARHQSSNDPGELAVAYLRIWCKGPWKYRIVAVDVVNARLLSTTVEQTWEAGRERIEKELREQFLIA